MKCQIFNVIKNYKYGDFSMNIETNYKASDYISKIDIEIIDSGYAKCDSD